MCCSLLAPVTLSLTTELPTDADRMEKPSTTQRATPHWRMLSMLRAEHRARQGHARTDTGLPSLSDGPP